MDQSIVRSTRRSRILLATEASAPPRDCLGLAEELVSATGAELSVLRVEPNSREFAAKVAARAAEVGARLLLVPSREHSGQRTNTVLQATGIPVLVVWSCVSTCDILAATSLRYTDFPVLRGAAEIGRILGANVAAIHNVVPDSTERHEALCRVRDCASASVKERGRMLIEATYVMRLKTAVLTHMVDTVEAILHEARLRNASLIVAGTHLSENRRVNTVPIDLVNLASRSVLLVPLTSTVASIASTGALESS